MSIEYDPTRVALYSPEKRATLFVAGKNYSDSQLAIEAARLAYVRAEQSSLEEQRLNDALAQVGFEPATLFNDVDTDTQAFGAYRKNDATTLVAFRGTQPDAKRDLSTDLKVLMVDWAESAGRVHQGFATALRSVRSQIDRWLQAEGNGGRLIFTGHSLGAALATLAASVWKPTLLLTLGSPRVGDAEFVRKLEAINVMRMVDCCDFVTDVPPEIAGYRHLASATYITRSGEVIDNPDKDFIKADRTQADLEYLKTYASQPLENVLSRRLADHAPINYARAFF